MCVYIQHSIWPVCICTTSSIHQIPRLKFKTMRNITCSRHADSKTWWNMIIYSIHRTFPLIAFQLITFLFGSHFLYMEVESSLPFLWICMYSYRFCEICMPGFHLHIGININGGLICGNSRSCGDILGNSASRRVMGDNRTESDNIQTKDCNVSYKQG